MRQTDTERNIRKGQTETGREKECDRQRHRVRPKEIARETYTHRYKEKDFLITKSKYYVNYVVNDKKKLDKCDN